MFEPPQNVQVAQNGVAYEILELDSDDSEPMQDDSIDPSAFCNMEVAINEDDNTLAHISDVNSLDNNGFVHPSGSSRSNTSNARRNPPCGLVIQSTSSASSLMLPGGQKIKDERRESYNNNNSVLENDPMGLLEFNDSCDRNSTRFNYQECDDLSSTASSSAITAPTRKQLEWTNDYQWLLHEEADEWNGYCLYCDVNISVRSQKSARQHENTMSHQERSENYMKFQYEEERLNVGQAKPNIKHEFGTDSFATAMKLKRKAQAKAFIEFNWRRWLEECPWLVRDSDSGTMGRCRYCNIQMNVEFTHLRRRHQEGNNHKMCIKEYAQVNGLNEDFETEGLLANDSFLDDDEEEYEIDGDGNMTMRTLKRGYSKYPCLEVVDNACARCTICHTIVSRSNFKRHLGTNLHIQNANKYNVTNSDQKVNTPPVNDKWSAFKNIHPWLQSDPLDGTFGYCKYCERRLPYGHSQAKREVHEKSNQHKINEMKYFENHSRENEQQNITNAGEGDSACGYNLLEYDKEDSGDGDCNNDEENEDKDNNDEGQTQSDPDDNQDEESDKNSEETTKKPIRRNGRKWYNSFPWCRRYKKDANCCYCTYCKVLINKNSRHKHNKSKSHKKAEVVVVRRHQLKQSSNNTVNYEWADSARAQPGYYYCKYCCVQVSHHFSKKQHALTKRHLMHQQIYLQGKPEDSESKTANSSSPSTSFSNIKETSEEMPKLIVKLPSFTALLKHWQKRFSWLLSSKKGETRLNYAYCKLCDQSFYVRSLKHIIRHQRSPKHVSTVNQLTNKENAHGETRSEVFKQLDQREKLDNVANNSKQELSPRGSSYKSTLESMQQRYKWIEKSSTPNYGYCRYCNVEVPLKVLFLRNHSNMPNHRSAEACFVGKKPKIEKETNSDHENTEDDEYQEDDDDEVGFSNTGHNLISDQDDNICEEIDDAFAIFNQPNGMSGPATNTRHKRSRSEHNSSVSEERPSKRMRTSLPLPKHNQLSAALASKILATSLSMATSLSPYIQRKLQTNSSGQNSDAADNAYDFFFKSIRETMKKLPVDLAAEAKVKIMQVMGELEVIALKRQRQQTMESANTIDSSMNTTFDTSAGDGDVVPDADERITSNGSINGCETEPDVILDKNDANDAPPNRIDDSTQAKLDFHQSSSQSSQIVEPSRKPQDNVNKSRVTLPQRQQLVHSTPSLSSRKSSQDVTINAHKTPVDRMYQDGLQAQTPNTCNLPAAVPPLKNTSGGNVASDYRFDEIFS